MYCAWCLCIQILNIDIGVTGGTSEAIRMFEPIPIQKISLLDACDDSRLDLSNCG